MANKIQLDIVSDVVCPWCIIGYKRLEQAIRELGIEEQISIEWQPFELNPHLPPEGESLREHLAKKYGTTAQESAQARENLTRLGAEVGFQFDYFEEMRTYDTREAHILLQYAKEQGKQTELKLRLFNAFFAERKNVADRETLVRELQAVGLNADDAMQRLDDVAVRAAVEGNAQSWRELGITSVPTVVFNRSSAISGAQPVEVYKQILTELLEE